MRSMRIGRLKQMSLMAASVMLFTLTALCVAIALVVWAEHAPLATIARTLELAQPWLFLWRVTLFAVVIGGWPMWARLIARWRSLSTADYERLVAARWTLALWLTVLEVVLGHNVVGRFIHLLTHAIVS